MIASTKRQKGETKRRRLDESARKEGSKTKSVGLVCISDVDAPPVNEDIVELWKAKRLCDVTVRVEGRPFQAHRLILASASEYFNALFCEPDRFKDSSTPQIDLRDMSASAFEAVLNWIYEKWCVIREEDLVELIHAADRLRCKGKLMTEVEAALAKRVDADTCLELWQLAERMELCKLMKAAESKACQCFQRVSSSKEFKSVPEKCVRQLLSSGKIVVSDAGVIFRSLMEWCKAQPEPLDPGQWERVLLLIDPEPSTCLEIWDIAEEIESEQLAKKAKKKALECFVHVTATDEFKALSAERLMCLLASDYLIAPSEDTVFSSVIGWVKDRPEPLAPDQLEQLLSHVRFPRMSENFFNTRVEKELLLLEHPHLMISVLKSFTRRNLSILMLSRQGLAVNTGTPNCCGMI